MGPYSSHFPDSGHIGEDTDGQKAPGACNTTNHSLTLTSYFLK